MPTASAHGNFGAEQQQADKKVHTERDGYDRNNRRGNKADRRMDQ